MLSNFRLPPTGFGPGSQPGAGDGQEFDYLPMPSGMRTFEGHLPEVEDAAAVAPALDLLAQLAAACDAVAGGGAGQGFDLAGLDPASRRLVAETMGEGEVAGILGGAPAPRVQESVFAGVWTLAGAGIDRIEVAPVPAAVAARAFVATMPGAGPQATRGPGVVNAPAIAAELFDRSAHWQAGIEAHVVNLSLLPHTPEDLDFLDVALGRGSATLLSRGYGNCRVTATALPQVWRVQFFNSMDTLILDSLEVTAMPEAVLAAREDFEDSAARLREVLEAIR